LTDAWSNIATIIWDMPGKSMNVIDLTVIEELGKIVERVATDAAIKGAVITSGKDTFSGGADLTLLESLTRVFAEMAKNQGEEQAATVLFEESRKLNSPERGHLAKSGTPMLRHLREWRVPDDLHFTDGDVEFALGETRYDDSGERIGTFLAVAQLDDDGRMRRYMVARTPAR
jgi:hypothetical protein